MSVSDIMQLLTPRITAMPKVRNRFCDVIVTKVLCVKAMSMQLSLNSMTRNKFIRRNINHPVYFRYLLVNVSDNLAMWFKCVPFSCTFLGVNIPS
jgi:hypothetical protein